MPLCNAGSDSQAQLTPPRGAAWKWRKILRILVL